MGIKQSGLLTIIVLMLVSCAGCTNTVSKPLPGINISADRVNTYVRLVDTPELLNSHKNGDSLSLAIVNQSDATIVFPEFYGVKIFRNEGSKWLEVQNGVQNSEGTFYLPTKADYPLGLIVDTAPYILDLESPTPVRIIVVGYKENDNEQVGAYIDVMITP
jgi:hypothetical protein